MSWESEQRARREKAEKEAYAKLASEEALERQERAKLERHACCWEPVTGPHHPVCANAEDPDAPPPLIEGQESLA